MEVSYVWIFHTHTQMRILTYTWAFLYAALILEWAFLHSALISRVVASGGTFSLTLFCLHQSSSLFWKRQHFCRAHLQERPDYLDRRLNHSHSFVYVVELAMIHELDKSQHLCEKAPPTKIMLFRKRDSATPVGKTTIVRFFLTRPPPSLPTPRLPCWKVAQLSTSGARGACAEEAVA